MNQGIGIFQAMTLIDQAGEMGFPKIQAELKRIGVEHLTNLMGNDQKKRIYNAMYHNDPVSALKHLANYPSEGEPAVYEDEKVIIQ